MQKFKVSTSTDSKKLAEAIWFNLKDENYIELSCLGAGAVNQAVKSFITAKSVAAPYNVKLTMDPFFAFSEESKEELTLIKFIITKTEIED